MKTEFEVIELLCGSGGGTEGCHQSDQFKVKQGLNHSPSAIAVNKANHPYIDFKIQDLYKATKKDVGTCDVLIAGIECTNHSNAKGGMSKNADSRAMANELFRFSIITECGMIIIENVREFLEWGPLIKKRDKNGIVMKIKRGKDKGKPIWIPDPNKKGQYFHKWKYKLMHQYGFSNYSQRILCAADYGIPTIRKRLFIVFAKKEWNISWPEPTHSNIQPNLLRLKPWVACGDYIDLENHGKSIFGRKLVNGTPNPLAESTLKRIAYGIKKYKGKNQFIAKSYSKENNVSSVDNPLGTVTTKDRHALISIEQFYLQNYHNSTSVGQIDKPLNTIVRKDEKALITVEKIQFIDKYLSSIHNVSSINDPLGTITTNPSKALITAEFGPNQDPVNKDEVLQFIAKHYGGNHASSLNQPLGTITRVDHNALISCHVGNGKYLIDIKMRWLNPRELSTCQGFPKDYILLGTQKDQKSGIGNSIPPGLIKEIANSLAKVNQHILKTPTLKE